MKYIERNKQAGQALVFVALGLAVLLGMLGLGIDIGALRYDKRLMQTAADAAAVAGGAELTVGDVTAAAKAASSQNGFTDGTNGVTVTVNNPPTTSGDPHNGNSKYVEVIVSQNQPTYFAKVFGVTSVSMSARAEGAQGSGSNCIFTLDQNGNPGLAVDFLASVSSQCGVVDESTSSTDALQCAILAGISASSIGVVGKGVEDFLCGISPTPKTGIKSPGDPLASTPAPTVGACGTTTSSPYTGYPGTSSGGLTISGNATLNPGVYCGGLNIAPGANVTMASGTYILTAASKGTTYGLTVDIGTTVNGNGVTFYDTAGGVAFNFTSFTAGGVNLVAPTSGTYEGILFFQPSSNTTQAQIIGSSSFNTVLQGTYYFPGAKVVFAFDGPVQYNILDAADIEFAVLTFGIGTFNGGSFYNNYSSLANGSPVKGATGVLVE